MGRRGQWLAVAGLVALVWVVFWPALRGQFIWDDDDHLTANAAVAAPDGLLRIWSSLSVSRYYPLTLTSFWVQRQLWGLNPWPYHAVTIGLHALSAVLLFTLLRQWHIPGAWVAAAVWAVHPVNVESVAWITELKNTQSAVFFFASLLAYTKWMRERRKGWYACALVCFAAALLSKPSTVTLPVVLLLTTWWERRRLERNEFLGALPFFALSAGMSLLTVIEQQRHVAGIGYEWTLPVIERLQLAGRTLWFYAGKVLWPGEVMFVYPRWTSVTGWLPALGVLGVAILLWVCRRQDWARASIAGLGSYVALLLPVAGLVDVFYFRYSFVSDHFQYLASAALIALVVAGFTIWVQHRRLQWIAGVVVIAGLGAISWAYTPVFHDEVALWRDTLSKNPNAVLALNNLGRIMYRRGEYAEAERLLRNAVSLEPRIWQGHLALANTSVKLGKLDAAMEHYRLALALRPRLAEAHHNLGMVLRTCGQEREAVEHLRKAIELRPEYVESNPQLVEIAAREW